MIFKKRQVLMAALVVALGAAVFVNWYYTKQPQTVQTNSPVSSTQQNTENQEAATAGNLGDAQFVSGTLPSSENKTDEPEYFVQAKLDRTVAHDKAKETLQQTIDSSTADAESKKAASEALEKLSANIKKETDTENLIKAKISSGCVVVIDNGKAQVIVEKGKLNDTAVLQIKEIVIQQTGFTVENITIIEAK
mgnify:FL=1